MRLLFNVYDVRRSGYIELTRLRRFLNVIYGETIAEHEPTQRMLRGLFSNVKRAREVDLEATARALARALSLSRRAASSRGYASPPHYIPRIPSSVRD